MQGAEDLPLDLGLLALLLCQHPHSKAQAVHLRAQGLDLFLEPTPTSPSSLLDLPFRILELDDSPTGALRCGDGWCRARQ